MMCIRHGAAYVVAFEMFEAMADAAREVIRHNGMEDKILVVPAKSCDVDSLPFAPDIVLSELLDTALLGEGVLHAHGDAIDRFVDPTPDAASPPDSSANDIRLRVLPYAGTVVGQLVESTELLHMATVDGQCMGGFSPVRAFHPIPTAAGASNRIHCPWGRVLPVHWETQFQDNRRLSAPSPLLHVEFFHSLSSYDGVLDAANKSRLTVTESGIIHGLLMWWTVDLLPPELTDGDSAPFSYSTEPGAAHVWQDHWQQMVFPLGGHDGGLVCEKGDVFEVTTSHDGVNMWCSLERIPLSSADDDIALKRPRIGGLVANVDSLVVVPPEPSLQCQCGWHLLCGPERMLCLNDERSLSRWRAGVNGLVEEMLQQRTSPDSAIPLVLDMSDGSLLAFMTAAELTKRTGPGDGSNLSRPLARVLSLERKPYSALFHAQLIAANLPSMGAHAPVVLDDEEWAASWLQGGGVCPVWEEAEEGGEGEGMMLNHYVAAVVCECFFYQLHSLPIQSALSFYYAVNGIKESRNIDEAGGGGKLLVCPQEGRIMIAAFELSDLHVSHGRADM